MKPAGIILTFMSREDWIGKTWWIKLRTLFFNCVPFVFQLMFMVIATVYGEIKWEKRVSVNRADWIAVGVLCLLTISIWFIPKWWDTIPFVIVLFMVIATLRNIDWRRVWRAAQCSHVRLCLRDVLDVPSINIKDPVMPPVDSYQYINFGYPKAELQYWRMEQCDGKRFEYRDATFPTPPEFMNPVIQYAEDQVGKRYDEVQLLSPAVNLPLWMFRPKWWGHEKIKAFNRPGGLEYCVSGVVADLRWGERDFNKEYSMAIVAALEHRKPTRIKTQFFPGYDPTVIPPCLVALDENWRRE